VVTIIISTGFDLFEGADGTNDTEFVAKLRVAAEILKIFKALRPLRLLRLPMLRSTLDSIVYALPALKSAIIIDFLLLYVFGILGVQMLCGRLSACEDEKWRNKVDCLANDSTWVRPMQNHDNIFASMLTFFEI